MRDDKIRCKRIIDGKAYNTETATLLGRWESDDALIEEALFKTRQGAYFRWGFFDTGPEEWLVPLDLEAARTWMEIHGRAEMFEAEFGEMPEAGDPEKRITLRIPEVLHKRIAIIAQERKQSLNAWILRCIEHAAEGEI